MTFNVYRDLPADELRGNPLHAWGALHAAKLGTYWTIPVDVPLTALGTLRPVMQSKARLSSIIAALRAGKPLPPVELGVFRDGSAWLVDGNHRLIAARKERLATLPVTFTFVGASPPPATAEGSHPKTSKTSKQLDNEIAEALNQRRSR